MARIPKISEDQKSQLLQAFTRMFGTPKKIRNITNVLPYAGYEWHGAKVQLTFYDEGSTVMFVRLDGYPQLNVDSRNFTTLIRALKRYGDKGQKMVNDNIQAQYAIGSRMTALSQLAVEFSISVDIAKMGKK